MVQTANPTVTQTTPPPPVQGPNPVPVGTDLYDWHSVNQALIAAGMNGWNIAGQVHTPTNVGQNVRNPSYDAVTNPNVPEIIWQEGKQYVIGVVSPDGTETTKVTLVKGDPDQNGNYKWSVVDREPPTKIAPDGGYDKLQRLPFRDGHEEIWGVNTKTGIFEKLPTQPTDLGNTPKGWTDVKLIDTTQNGKPVKMWVGTDPDGKPLQPVPNAPPPIATDAYVPGSVKQVTITQNGRQVQVWRGLRPGATEWEDIPSLGSEPVKPTPTTLGRNVYKVGPNGELVIDTNVAQPTEGKTRWVDAGGGNAKQQTFRNGDWEDDVDVAQKPVSPETQRAAGAILPKGTPTQVLTSVNGRSVLLDVVADGNGGYTIPTDTKAHGVPGAPSTKTPITAPSDQPNILRSNPDTGEIETSRNPNYQPTAIGDRVVQLRELALAKQKELHDKIGQAGYTPEQADKDFNSWYDTEIEPRRQQMQFDQDALLRKANAEDQTARQAALTAAQSFGTQGVTNFQNQQKYMHGPGYTEAVAGIANAISQGKPAPQISPSALEYQAPSYNDMYQYYTAQALRAISPTAAAMLGGQPTALQAAQGMDLGGQGMLGRTNFQPSGQPQSININITGAGAGGGTPAVTTNTAAPAASAAPAPAPFDYAAWQQRQAADVAAQRAQAQIRTTQFAQSGLPEGRDLTGFVSVAQPAQTPDYLTSSFSQFTG